MNKIIEDFAEQAGLECNEHAEKFAQLLLRYLVDKVRDTNVNHLVYTTYDQAISQSCKHALVRRLEELL